MSSFLSHIQNERSDSIDDTGEVVPGGQNIRRSIAIAHAPSTGITAVDRSSGEHMDPGLDDFDRGVLQGSYPEYQWQSGRFGAGLGAAQQESSLPHVLPLGLAEFPATATGSAPGPRANRHVGLLPSSTAASPALSDLQGFRHDPRETDRRRPYGTGPVAAMSSVKANQQLVLGHAPPFAQGIRLIFTDELPDRFRAIFPFNPFNAVQSRCFDVVYRSDDNFVLAAPTGSGKTAILELAICRLLSAHVNSQFKIVYQAPTKALCAERQRDWERKFAPLDLRCAELTGDTDQTHLRSVQNANIIITTPEKWDSVTRRWKDHGKLMELVKLFLIDEVHILNDTRGATLEAVVSRMKTVSSDVRFVALSATIPNLRDVAQWLGRNGSNTGLPAQQERFGDEFRPVRLQKYVCGYKNNTNDFAFDKVCESKLPEVITKHSSRKPIMIFCCTRSSAISTAKFLAYWGAAKDPRDRFWPIPTQSLSLHNQELRNCASAGVAFHHGGLDVNDRQIVERSYLDGQISVICCTSTLAVGVNLPCHFVIIKNTMNWQPGGLREYADLEIMQMLGRAGRPQFDTSAVAVIMTRAEKARRYEAMVSGQETLESRLHLNLIEHLNAEIGLGSVHDMSSAKSWLKSTFLYVRLAQNPRYYELDAELYETGIDRHLEHICTKDISLLQEAELVRSGKRLRCSEYGDAMSRYYVRYETMKVFLALKPLASVGDVLQCLAKADEFKTVRLKAAEKSLYKELNKGNGIRFPINVDLALTEQKISLIIQAELGCVEFPIEEQYQKHRQQYHQDKGIIFQNVNRLVRCIVDCSIQKSDSVAVKSGLELVRSFAARVWDGSPLQMKQIDQIGPVAVRKLVAAGIDDVDSLASTEAHRIEMVLSRHPPFGSKIMAKAKEFPKLKIAAKITGKTIKPGEPVRVKVKAEIGFENEKSPTVFRGRLVFVCFVAESSDGTLAEFGRIHARKLVNGEAITFEVPLIRPDQYVSFSATCDEIAGTLRQIDLKPDIPLSLFPPIAPVATPAPVLPHGIPHSRSINLGGPENQQQDVAAGYRASAETSCVGGQVGSGHFSAFDFDDIDDFDDEPNFDASGGTRANELLPTTARTKADFGTPQRVGDGKWACNHRCKDKTACKHLCCREGLDKPPKGVPKPLNAGPPKMHQPPQGLIQAAKAASYRPIAEAYRNTPQSVIRRNGVEVLDLAPPDRVEKDKTTIDPRIRFDLQKNNLTNRSDPEKTLPSRTTDELSSDILPQTLAQRYTNTALGADGEGHCAHALPRSLAHHAKTLGWDTKDSTIPSFDEEFPDMDDELWGLEELITQGQASKGGNDQNIAAENNHEPAPEKRKNTLYSYWSSSPDREQPVTAESPPLLTANPGSSVVEYPFPLLASSPSKGSHSVIAPEVESKVVGKRTLEADEPDVWGHKRPRADQGHNTALQELANAASLERPQAAQTPVEPVQETPQPPALQGIDPDILAEFCDIVDFY